MFINFKVTKKVGTKWLFGFCEGSACGSSKTKCDICAVRREILKKYEEGAI